MDEFTVSILVVRLIYTCGTCGKYFYDVKRGFRVIPFCPHCKNKNLNTTYKEDIIEVLLNKKTGNIVPQIRSKY